MRVILQRVISSDVEVEAKKVGEIKKGLLILLGIGEDDDIDDINYLVDKIVNLRIFSDQDGRMNLSALDIGAELLVVSQFTLYGDCRKGRRPSFDLAASPKEAEKLYEEFLSYIKNCGLKVETGEFKTHMKVTLINDGPVTILLDSKKDF
ncbi:D-tyrosyl-tRNA(Tyr) deacylase [Orenia metallireducens]|jgi:D-tyrosyl-tRNA(Tyr) deacylase|uniref:D-aminoacyl-tRNA deacylase n=1 Tax=Orenia metallireducens TaxID=1413210 RepID=A0A285G9J4_9FIRM|nr:D-aminoacyl-tRNA deacylase [Orenia metallireducens]PRX24214.1 D-tyrosyl-tRNA(Tyr) deacylase [Orenia metallireducens]SNY19794.1 D-tyrosyl-tRNA(Tyr) deacylase [Orenia metallireducens]